MNDLTEGYVRCWHDFFKIHFGAILRISDQLRDYRIDVALTAEQEDFP